jgi:hypothetical protein
MTGAASQVRRESAVEKRKKSMQLAGFQVEGDDIVFTDGRYSGHRASVLFESGPEGRDFIVRHVWFSNNEDAMRIIRGWLCQ